MKAATEALRDNSLCVRHRCISVSKGGEIDRGGGSLRLLSEILVRAVV